MNLILKIFIYFFASLVLLGSGAFAFWFYQNKIQEPLPLPTPSAVILVSPSPIPSPSPSPAASLLPTPSPSEAATEETSDFELIKAALANRHSKPINETNLTINENTGTHASGLVSFTGEIAGGWWLAYNDGSGWLIVDDGNGTISCVAIEPYNFPTSMVPECYDEAAGVLVTR